MRLSRWCPLLLLPFALGAPAEEYGFRVQRAELVASGDRIVVNADIDYRFSGPAVDALEHGVPLTLVLSLRVRRHRDYWWDETIVNESRRFRILFHPLAKTFRLIQESNGVPASFAGFRSMLEAMREIRGWRVASPDQFKKGQEYWAALSVKLDIEALPLPLRPVAYVSPSWYLGSPWFKWRFEG